MAGLMGCIGAGLLLSCGNGSSGVASSDKNPPSEDEEDDNILTVPQLNDLLPVDLDLLLLTDSRESNLNRVSEHIQNARIKADKVRMDKLDWTDRTPYRGGLLKREEFHTILASDVAFTYPEAKELARTV